MIEMPTLMDEGEVTASGAKGPLLALLRRRRTVMSFTGVGVVIGLALALLLPPQFESSAELMPPEQSGSASLSAALASHGDQLPSLALSLLGGKTSGALFIGVLQSESAQDDLIRRFDLQREYGVKTMLDGRKHLLSQSSFSEDRKSGIVTIRVRDRDRHRAQAMCQEYVDVLNRLIAQDASSSARNEREFLEKRLVLAKVELGKAEGEFSRYAAANKAINIPEQTRATVGSAVTLQGQLAAAEAELNGLRQVYAAQNPRVLSAEARVATLSGKLRQLAGTEVHPGSSDELISPSLEKLPSVAVGYQDLSRNLGISEELVRQLSAQYELARVQEAKEIPTVRLLDPPSFPERKIAPSRTLLLAGCVILMCLTGCAWVVLCTVWEAIDPADARKQLVRAAQFEIRRDLLKLRFLLSAERRALR